MHMNVTAPNLRVGPTTYVLDDDPEVLVAIKTMLASVGLGCETFDNPELLLKADLSRCGCLILDLRMALMNGLEVQSALKERGVILPVIFISGHGDIPTALRAIRAGAVDFLEKPFRPQELLDRVNECLRQQKVGGLVSKRNIPMAQLTKRETEVARGLVAGKTSAEIAKDLGLSKRTIDMHRSRLLKRMNVRRSADAVRILAEAINRNTYPET